MKAGSTIRPLNHGFRFGRVGAKLVGIRRDADSPQIKPVGIPTGLNGDIRVNSFMSMRLYRRGTAV